MYDRRARSGRTPSGAHGEFRTGKGGNSTGGHSTQYYDDGYRLSRDTDGQSDQQVHWTNQSVPKGRRHRRKRHTPPPDAR
ncbi:MAG TPA: hypothetical protein VFZ58_03490 [Candidatus Saccharimonadales bacterium]